MQHPEDLPPAFPPIGIEEIEAAANRIAPYILPTPLLSNSWLSQQSGTEVWVKWESQQLTGSFKLRGALNKLLVLKARGIDAVMAVSAGNHGLGVAHAATLLGMRATIVVPGSAAATKVAAIRRYPVELLACGTGYDEAEQQARVLAAARQVEFVSPYNDAEVLAGQGTIALEMLAQQRFDLLLAPVGGGGLLAGVAIAAHHQARPEQPISVIGTQPANSTAMQSSFRAGKLINVDETDTLADGLAGNIEAKSITFPIIHRLVTDIVTVTESAIKQTIRGYLEHDHMIIEGSGAVSAAALLTPARWSDYSRIGVIATGRNIDLSRLKQILNEED